tara:strand:- start:35917 stop:37086 length:1170 start_codon:yes stop_codon:yes gene_type:complete
MYTNIENFLTIIEEINKTIDDLVVETDTWTGSTLSGTNRDIKGVEGDEEEKLKDEVKEKWGENFVGENDDTVYDILTEDEWIELVGENGEDAIKNLSTEDIEKVVLLKGAPKVRGYILRSGKYAGKLVIKPLLKSTKLVKGLVAGKKLSTLTNRKASKSSGFCFCNELAEEHDNSSSNGDWKKIRKNIVNLIGSKYTQGEGKIILKTYDRCEKDLGANLTDKNERRENASDCNVMKDALADFDNIMSPILSELGKYFRIKDQKREKSIKGKNTGEILASAKGIRLRFDDDKDVTIPGGGDCTDCFTSRPDGKIYNGMYIDITPIGGETDNSIRCKWSNQKSRVSYVLMKFENAKVGDSQTVRFTFYDNSANEMSVYTSCAATITKITTR